MRTTPALVGSNAADQHTLPDPSTGLYWLQVHTGHLQTKSWQAQCAQWPLLTIAVFTGTWQKCG